MLPHKKESVAGFTLVEVLVAFSLMVIVLMTIGSALLANTKTNRDVEDRSVATRIVEQTFERYRQMNNYAALSSPGSDTQKVSMNGQEYDVTVTHCSEARSAELKEKMPCSSSSVFLEIEVKQNDQSLSKVATYFTKFGAIDD